MPDLFTCVTCNVAFNNSELQRDHYKTDWHRYNLKRKVAEMPPVSAADFNDRLKLQKEQQENGLTQKNEELFCKLCSKHFTTANSFANHKQSKKHKELEETINKRNSESDTATDVVMTKNDQDYVVKSDRATKKAEQLLKRQQEQQVLESEVIMDDEDQSWEDIGDEEMDEFDESNAIDLDTCFFCDKKCENIDAKVEHMAREHSFYIPDLENVSDLEGFLKFLGMKLGTYHVCLWCSSKCYRDLLSVQKHMADKGHQKLKFEGETLLEYADYYAYDLDEDGTIDDDYDIVNNSDINNISRMSLMTNDSKIEVESVFGDENYELVLPSGARIGHRSLFKYYKQSFGHRSLELKQRNNINVKDKYRAIANGNIYNPAEIKKQRKDMAYFQRWNAKMRAKLGWETNKLQKHFRRQDITF